MTELAPSDAGERLRGRLARARRSLPAAPPGPVPLTATQAGLWYEHRLDPAGPGHHRPTVFRLIGPVDPEAVGRSIDEIVASHAALRSSFPMVDGRPTQRVHDAASVPLERIDLRAARQPDRDEARRQVRTVIAGATTRRFALEEEPPFAATLVTLDDDDHVLVLAIHHLVIDGPSADLVLCDLAARLEAGPVPGSDSEPPARPPLHATFAGWSSWSVGRVDADQRERQLAWWHQVLASPLPARPDRLASRSAGTEPAGPDDRADGLDGDERERDGLEGDGLGREELERDALVPDELRPVRLELPRPLADGLRAVARSTSVTTFAALLAGLQATLLDVWGTDDVVFALPITDRRHPDAERLVGCFISLLPLRLRVGPGDSGRDLMVRAGATVISALDHQAVALSEIVSATMPRNRDGRAASPVMATVQLRAPAPRIVLDSGLVVERLPVVAPPDGFGLVVTDDGSTMAAELSVAVVEGGRAVASGLLDAFVGHLAELVGSPDRPLRPLADERRATADDPSDARTGGSAGGSPSGSSGGPADVTVAERFLAMAEAHADRPAVEHGDRVLTYAELLVEARRLADDLRAEGVGPGHTVGIDLDRSLECVVAMVGIVLAGGIYVPVDRQSPTDRIAAILDDAGVELLVRAGGVERLAPRAAPRLPADTGPGAPIYVIYTSGSTGVPKGVVIHHRGVVQLVCDTDYITLEPGDRVAFAASPAFDVTTFDVWGPLLNGGCTVVVPPEVLVDPAQLEGFLRDRRITTLDLNTAVFNAIVRQRPAAFASLRDLCFGGEAVEPRWVRAVLEAGPPRRLVHNYGPTETTVLASWELVEHVDAEAATVPIGRPLAHTTLHLLDEHGRPVPAGVPGEIHVGGSRIALGYLGRPELDAERFVPDPFSPGDSDARLYRSGDLAVARLDGRLEFVGRIDTQVKVRGYRVELGEIETAIARHPHIDLVVVHAWRRDDDTVLVAYVVAAEGAEPVLDDLRAHLRELVPPYMVPARLVRLDRLPLTPNDKVDRAALPEPEWGAAPSFVAPGANGSARSALPAEAGGAGGQVDDAGTADDVARDVARMAELWAKVLDLHRVEPDADFFELGGHSLVAIALLAAVADEFGVDLGMSDLVDGPTPNRMTAAVLASGEGWEAVRDGALELAPGRPDAELAPLVLIPPIFGVQPVIDARSLGRRLEPSRRVLLIELQGRSGRELPLDTMSGLVTYYLERLGAIVPTGPVVLAGHSLGGAIALEMARRLDDQRVQAVVMFDSRIADDEQRRWATVVRRPLRRARSAVRRRRGIPTDVGAEVKAATRRAWWTYRPQPWSGRVVYLAARGTDEKPEDLRRDEPWLDVLSGIEVHETAGGHSGVGSLLDEPHVADTALRLIDALAAPDAARDQARIGPTAG